MIYIFISFFAFSDVNLLLKAKSAGEIEDLHKKEVQIQVLHERCEVELNQKWIPRTCFLWLKQAELSASDKKKMQELLNMRCVEALLNWKNKVFPAGFLKNLQKGSCYETAQQQYLDQHYQMQKQAPLQAIEQHLKVGREFESSRIHESEKDYKN